MLETTNNTKVLIRVWPKIFDVIKKDMSALHAKRDKYINSLIATEIELLNKEVEIRQDNEVKRTIKRYFRELSPIPMTIVLDKNVKARMAEVLAEKNISRNSFVNRVLFFLVAKKEHLRALGIPYQINIDTRVKPLDEAKAQMQDPFFHIRAGSDNRFYTLSLHREPPAPNWPSLFGLNCAITAEDWATFNSPPVTDLFDMDFGIVGGP